MIFDSHAHYDDAAFDEDREALLGSFLENGVGYVVNAGSTLASVEKTLELAETYPFMYGALGIHPSEVKQLCDRDFDWLRTQLEHKKAVAVGEIGLDYYWDKEEAVQKKQREWFAQQLELAKEIDKPVVIHSREAAKDTLDVMAACGGSRLRSVVHCFSYTKETAREFLKWDYYFGIGGVVTFQNAKKVKEVAAWLPMDRILLETDCPYLAPVPHRGERNSSLNLPLVAKQIAELRHMTAEEVIEITCQNAKRFYGIA